VCCVSVRLSILLFLLQPYTWLGVEPLRGVPTAA
jgi:hypothetical protein